MEKNRQKIAGVACLTLAFGISVSHFIFVSPETKPIFAPSSLASLSTTPLPETTPVSPPPLHVAEASPPPPTLVSSVQNAPKEELVLAQAPPSPPKIKKEVLQISRGETLVALLRGAGIDKSKVQQALAALKPVYNTKSLKAGQDINIKCKHHPDQSVELVELSFHPDLGKNVSLALNKKGEFKAALHNTPIKKELKKISFKIQSTLLASATAKGIPARVANSLIRAFSHDIDFQRDIKKGDNFSVVFERHYDPQSGRDRVGDVVYAQITPSKKNPIKLYRFASNGKISFYNEHGASARKSLMKTPINGARVNSGFGKRSHPISGFTKKHEGVDFGAPTGTLVFAAGDGVVVKASRSGGLGNLVKIQHNKEYATAYAHLSKFAKNIRPGTKVKQGSPIGYVGQTGQATGPHLHFEVHKNGVKVNPLLVANLSSGKLEGKDLKKFLAAKKSIDHQMAKLSESAKFALDMRPEDHS